MNYCKNLLTNRDTTPGYEKEVETKKILHKMRMEEYVRDDIVELTIDMFNKTLKDLWKNKKEKYKFIHNAGHSLKNALFHLFKVVWKDENLPHGWRKTTLLQLYKGKGDFREMENTRNLHIKDLLPPGGEPDKTAHNEEHDSIPNRHKERTPTTRTSVLNEEHDESISNEKETVDNPAI